jgi:hypothetical protein
MFQALYRKLQWHAGVKAILGSDRLSLCEQDLKTNLYPFVLAASLADDACSDCEEAPTRKRQKLTRVLVS